MRRQRSCGVAGGSPGEGGRSRQPRSPPPCPQVRIKTASSSFDDLETRQHMNNFMVVLLDHAVKTVSVKKLSQTRQPYASLSFP